MMRRAILAAAMIMTGATCAHAADLAPVEGDAAAGLVSRSATGEVHLVADPELNAHRLVMKLVILNRSAAPQHFGPEAVSVSAGDAAVALVPRDDLLAEIGGSGRGDVETSQAHAAAAMPTNEAGQADVTGFTGGGGSMGGVPISTLDRTRRKADSAAVAQLDAVLLKPMTIAPGAADGGQIVTAKLKRSKAPELTVSVAFAGDTHRFRVKVP